MDHFENQHWLRSTASQQYYQLKLDGSESHSADNDVAPKAKRQRAARKAQPTFDPTNTSVEAILYGDPDLVRRDALLRVAEFYSNTEIFQILNANRESRGLKPIKSANNITKMLTAAVHGAAARIEGATTDSIRLKLKEARQLNKTVAPRVHEFDFRRNIPLQQNTSIVEQHGPVLQQQQQQQLTETMATPPQTMCYQAVNYWDHMSSECFVPDMMGFPQTQNFCQDIVAEQQHPTCRCFGCANNEVSQALQPQIMPSWSDHGYHSGIPEYASSAYPTPDGAVGRSWEGR